MDPSTYFRDNGFMISENIYTKEEITKITTWIEQADPANPAFRRSSELFAIRRFLSQVPEVFGIIWNEKLQEVVKEWMGPDYFIVKSIYFDKPEASNWFVAYHQDLTISVDKKLTLEGFGPWTTKQDQFAVQPPLEILENIYTIRIHLDDTDEKNGALKVIPGSHRKGVFRPENIDWTKETTHICEVPAGGIMIMRPLLLHSSGKSTSGSKRRVIHIEFSNRELPGGLSWVEKRAL
jgi:ectoine hydroxylase-related dioxygenase (phytanoyl-CoA dioxygenase family)